MATKVDNNRAYSLIHCFSVDIPQEWEIRDVFGVDDPDAIMNLAPIGAKWPNIEITYVGTASDPSIEAIQRFARRFLREQGWPSIQERQLTVAGLPAFEVSYKRQFPFWVFWARERYYCKVSVLRGNAEYLIQLASEDLNADKPIFDAFVRSLEFESLPTTQILSIDNNVDSSSEETSLVLDEFVDLILRFMSAETWEATQRFLEQYPELLSEKADTVLASLIQKARREGREDFLPSFEEHRALLARCRQVGVRAAFAQKMSPAMLLITPELIERRQRGESIEDMYVRAPHLTNEEILLQRSLANLPVRVRALLEEIAQLDRPEMPRRLELCQQALRSISRQDHAIVWAFLQSILAETLVETSSIGKADNVERAFDHLEQALTIYTQDKYPENWARVQRALGHAYWWRIRGDRAKNLEQAIIHCEEALTVYTRTSHPQEWAMVQDDLGNAYQDRIRGDRAENLERSIYHHKQALEVKTRRAYPKGWALTQSNLGEVYRKRIRGDKVKNLEQAMEHFRLALEVYKQDRYPWWWANVHSNLGNVFGDRIQGDPADNLEQAIHHHKQALEVYTQETYPEDWARVQNSLGNVYTNRICGARVENLEWAIEHFNQALLVRTREAFPERWARTHNNLGAVHAESAGIESTKDKKKSNLMRAVHHFEQALEVYTPIAFPADNLLTQRNLGHLFFAEERWLEAVRAYQGTLAVGDLLYQIAATPEARQAELREIRDLPAHLAYAAGKTIGPRRAQALRESVVALERNRARWLSEALALRDDKPPTVPEEVWYVFLNQRNEVRHLQTEARLPEGTPGKRGFLALSEAFRVARKELNEAVARVREHDESFMPDLTFAQVQAVAALGCPLAYVAITSAGAFGLVVSAQPPEGSEPSGDSGVYPVWSELTEDEFNKLLVQRNGEEISGYLPSQFNIASMDAALEELLPTLGEQLVGPLAERLRAVGASGVVMISGGILGLLPLHAARYQRDDQELCLLDEFDVAYAPSARVLTVERQALVGWEGAPLVLAGVGNPLENPHPLPFAQSELEGVATFFPVDARRTLYEHAATKDALLDVLPGATYVHLSCHGTFDPGEPLDSHLQLAGEEPFTLREVLGADYLDSARLTVLSACQTAITDFNNLPDEVIGLPAGFLQAGVRGVVGTLWPVSDLSTALLMVKFYEYHLHGDPTMTEVSMPPARALCRAQCWLRDVTAGELLDYFQRHKALHQAHRRAERQRMSEEVAAAGVIRFGLEDPDSQPFVESPYHWAPFIFVGV